MERIKQGYKQTDIGVIPEDWDVKSVRETFRFLSNATYSRAELNTEGVTQYIHYGDIHTKYHEFIDFNMVVLPKVTERQAIKYPSIQDGDIIMADASEDYIGLCKSVEAKNIEDKNVISGLHTILLRAKGSCYKNGFKGYLFLIPEVRKQLIGLATGMKVYGVSKSNLPHVLLPIPTSKEQTAIATALGDTDALIATLDKKIAKKQQIKQGAMQQLLTGKKRLSGFSGECVEKTIFECCNCLDNQRVPLNELQRTKGKYPYCGANGIVDYINRYIFNEKILLIAEDGGYFDEFATRPIAYQINEKCWVNNHAHVLKAKNGYSQDFIYYLLVNKDITEFINGGTRSKLNRSDLDKIILRVPTDESEQTAIAQILTDMDNEIAQLEKERNKYKELKAGMMQVLLTGKVRLK